MEINLDPDTIFFSSENVNPEELMLSRSIQEEMPWLEAFAWMLSKNQEDALDVIGDLVYALYLSPIEEKAKLQVAAAEWVTHEGDDQEKIEKETNLRTKMSVCDV